MYMRPLTNDFRINGETIYLRPIMENDTDMVLTWRNSEFVVNNFFYRLPISREEHLAWLRNKVNKGEVFQFIVCMKQTDEPIGCVYLQHYISETNSMESGVFMSEAMPHGKGIGTEAVSLLNYEFAFANLKLTKTVAKVLTSNVASMKLHEKVGFTEVSRQQDVIVPQNVSCESVLYELKRVNE